MNNVIPFGTAPSGEPVYLVQLNNGTLSCEIITFGATIRSLMVPDRNGHPVDVVLGYDTLKEYAHNGGYLGATIGRFANRIDGSRFTLNGQIHKLSHSFLQLHLHGGRKGFSHRVWKIVDAQDTCVTLSLHSLDGEEGYPGNLNCTVTFTLEDDTLTIRYQAISDQDTICSLTNHSYFNLAGHASGTVMDQEIQIFSQSYTPSGSNNVPLGYIEPIAGTPMDLRSPIRIGARIEDDFPPIRSVHGFDHNYVIDGDIGTLRPAAGVYDSKTGIAMDVKTTMPGMQFYTGNYIPNKAQGKGGCRYGSHHGFCLETQFFPDSPNQPSFPSPILKAGEKYDHCTSFRFSVK